MPADLTGKGEPFMPRGRGESMTQAGILDGARVVCPAPVPADEGDLIVAGIPGDEATVKTISYRDGSVVLLPSNRDYEPMVFQADDVSIYGRVVTVMRKL